MAIYECPACGHKCKCPLENNIYEESHFEFWCMGDTLLHGRFTREHVNEHMKKYFSPTYHNHPAIKMHCINTDAIDSEDFFREVNSL